MLSRSRPLDMAALAMAVSIGVLAVMQWRASASFHAGSIAIDARVVELRAAKKSMLDPAAEVFALVEFETPGGDIVRAELPSSVQSLGLDPSTVVGTTIAVAYDPAAVRRVRYGGRTGLESALVLALLAVGALFAPLIFRRMSLHGGGGG